MLSFGPTTISYCRRHALKSKTFAAWIKRCNTSAVPAKLSLTLVPITVTQPAAAGELFLRYASGWQLVLTAGVFAGVTGDAFKQIS
jgi:hypothetical protein